MPDQPSWIDRVAQIIEDLRMTGPPLLDRATVERVFGLSPRQANRVMRACGGSYVIGRSVVVPCESLLAWLHARVQSGAVASEVTRRRRLYDTLADARNEAKRRRIVIPVKQDAFERTFDDLPAGISFAPGLLQVHFTSTVDLLEKLFGLAQALSNDMSRLEEMVDPAPPRP